MPEVDKHTPEWLTACEHIGSALILYGLARWGFSKEVKQKVYERQGGLSPEGRPIEEYHHIVPENALKRKGIKGKNVAENCVGLSFDEHKHKWDILMQEGVFYPGVALEELNPDTYVIINHGNERRVSNNSGYHRHRRRR
jgi:hypothetical protein